jgi:hypothetical protein
VRHAVYDVKQALIETSTADWNLDAILSYERRVFCVHKGKPTLV